jgi:hypothetical protein
LINPSQFSSVALEHSTESTGSATDNNGFEYSTDTEDHESGRYSLDSESPRLQHKNVVTENTWKAKAGVVPRGHHMIDDYYYEHGRYLHSSKSNSISDLKSESRQESFGYVGQKSTEWHEAKPKQNRYDHEDPSGEEEEEDDEREESWDTDNGVAVMPPSSQAAFSAYSSEVHIQVFIHLHVPV